MRNLITRTYTNNWKQDKRLLRLKSDTSNKYYSKDDVYTLKPHEYGNLASSISQALSTRVSFDLHNRLYGIIHCDSVELHVDDDQFSKHTCLFVLSGSADLYTCRGKKQVNEDTMIYLNNSVPHGLANKGPKFIAIAYDLTYKELKELLGKTD